MDDNSLNQAFGGAQPQSVIEEKWHQAMERKKYDIIRVKNPTAKDFYVMYDTNQYQKVAANSTIDIPRYIATRYVEHMKDEIVNARTQKMHDDYLAQRDAKGLPRYTDKATENKETYETDSYPKTDDPKVIAEIYDTLWVGLVYEFGRDMPPSNLDPRSGEVDVTPVSMKVLDTLNTKRVADTENPLNSFRAVPTPPPSATPPPMPEQPSGFSAMSEKLSANDVTQE